MKKQQYKIDINAPRETVWGILWGEETYPKWTAPFAEGSSANTDWKKGSKVLFHDGKGNGMVARIEDNVPNTFMSIQHLGEVKGGVEDTESEKVKEWAGAIENYTLKGANGKTELVIDMDVTEQHVDMFNKMWPKALAKVKDLSEKAQG